MKYGMDKSLVYKHNVNSPATTSTNSTHLPILGSNTHLEQETNIQLNQQNSFKNKAFNIIKYCAVCSIKRTTVFGPK